MTSRTTNTTNTTDTTDTTDRTEPTTEAAADRPAGPRITPYPKRGALSRAVAATVRRPALTLSVLVLLTVLGWAFLPGLFTSQDPLDGDPGHNLQGPSAAHWFGTDRAGRDLYARIVHGASLSLRATVLAVLVALVVGALLGLVSGFVGGLLDDILMRVVDVLLAVPGLLLSLTIVTALGFGTMKVAVAVGLASVATFARVMRSEVLRVRTTPYVEAARLLGTRWYGVLFRHVLPNAAGPVLVLATLQFGEAVLAVSALSFLGFGASPPAPEWGSLISEGRNYLATSWWLTTFPGLTVAAVVLAANRVSRALEGETKERSVL